MDLEEIMRIRGKEIPADARRIKEETGFYPIPEQLNRTARKRPQRQIVPDLYIPASARRAVDVIPPLPGFEPEPPPKQAKQTPKPEQDKPSPTPGKWETLKMHLASKFKESWGKLATVLDKAKKKLKKQEDARQDLERQPKNAQTEVTPEPKPQETSPEFETWSLDEITGANVPKGPLPAQIFYGKRPEPEKLERMLFGSAQSKPSQIKTTPPPWYEDDEQDELEEDDPLHPKLKGPTR